MGEVLKSVVLESHPGNPASTSLGHDLNMMLMCSQRTTAQIVTSAISGDDKAEEARVSIRILCSIRAKVLTQRSHLDHWFPKFPLHSNQK